MSDEDEDHEISGVYIFIILTIIFTVLKLFGIIQWSWLWILSPLWGPILLVILVFLFMFIIRGIEP